MTALLLTLALSAPSQTRTLSVEVSPIWPQPDMRVVTGEGYREKWVTISVWRDGGLVTWGPWAPGRTNTLAKPLPGWVSGAVHRVDVRRGYQQTPTAGALLKSGEFVP